MSDALSETARITAEYRRRAREIPGERYSLANPAALLMRQQTERAVIGLLHRAGLFPLSGLRIADIGCGYGGWLIEFIQWRAAASDLAGIDLMPERAGLARERIPAADIRCGDAASLPWPDESFHLVTQFMLLMNIFDPAQRRAVAREMLRVLKPGGAILWFDPRVSNPRNPELKPVRAAEIRALFPHCAIDLCSVVLAPPLSRMLAARAWPLASLLHSLPFLRTHYAALLRKPA